MLKNIINQLNQSLTKHRAEREELPQEPKEKWGLQGDSEKGLRKSGAAGIRGVQPAPLKSSDKAEGAWCNFAAQAGPQGDASGGIGSKPAAMLHRGLSAYWTITSRKTLGSASGRREVLKLPKLHPNLEIHLEKN